MRRLALISCLAVTACGFDTTVKKGTLIRCASDDDCFKPSVCQMSSGYCVEVIDNDRPAIEGEVSVALDRDAFSVLAAADVMSTTSSTRVSFRTTKPVVTPQLSACADAVTCVLEAGDQRDFLYRCTFNSPAPLVERSCDVQIDLEDLHKLKNSITVPAAFRIDSIVPEAPPVDTPDAVVLTRVPWGSEATQGKPAFRVRAPNDGSVALVVWETAEPTASPIQVGAFGSGSLTLPNVDLLEVHIAAVDRAGNTSARVRVRDTELVASLGEEGHGRENPHRFDMRGAHSAALLRSDVVELGATPALAREDAGVLSTSGAWVWRERFYRAAPAFKRAAVTFDSARARVVSFGGTFARSDGGGEPTDALLEWNGEQWQSIETIDPERDGNPPRLAGAAMAYDARNQRSVLFGGETSVAGQFSADTWAFTGRSFRQFMGAVSPEARSDHAMAYDAKRGVIVLFGGRSAQGNALGDTWEWNGERWSKPDLVAAPSARSLHAMVWDDARRVVVMHGGKGTDGTARQDAWQFDGQSWSRLAALDGPEALYAHALVYDTRNDRYEVFGGTRVNGSESASAAVGRLDGGWTTVALSMVAPRSSGHAVYDVARGNAVVWGGIAPGPVGDLANPQTMTFDGASFSTAWSLSRLTPGPRANVAMTYHDDLARTLIYGGEFGPYRFDDLLMWDGVGFDTYGWPNRTPGVRTLASMAYDPRSKLVVLYGGAGEPQLPWTGSCIGIASSCVKVDAGTWVFDGGSWDRVNTVTPNARIAHGMYFEPSLGGVVSIGGSGLVPQNGGYLAFNNYQGFTDTFLFRDGVWTTLNPMPAASIGPGVAYDESRQTVVVLPGSSAFQQNPLMYERQFSTDAGWLVIDPQNGPPKITLQNLAYDAERKRVFQFGPPVVASDNLSADRIWEWFGTRWALASISDAEGSGRPSGRLGFRLAYDKQRGRTVMYGGATSDVWELESARRTPSHVFHVSLEGRLIPTGASFVGFAVRARAGADSMGPSPDGGFVPRAGVMLLPFISGRWGSPLGTNTAGASDPAAVSGALTSGDAARLLEAQRRTSVAIVPVGANGNGTATVATDYVEATVKYRLPAQ